MAKREPEKRWRFAYASVIGTSHERRGSPCQDASACKVFEHADASLLVAVASDGAGTARHSRTGAQLVCHVINDSVRALLNRGGSVEDIDQTFADDVIDRLRLVVDCVSQLSRNKARDFSCTLLAAFVGTERSAFMQVGDGAIVIGTPGTDDYEHVFWPQQGEFANETVFATGRHAPDDLRFEVRDGRIDEVALFSDGLQSMVLDYQKHEAHSGFFRPMFQSVRKVSCGHSQTLSRSLTDYLESPEITKRTDDDKTLVLASRRDVAQPQPRSPFASFLSTRLTPLRKRRA